ncbi:MAG: DUF3750 domain-containing protein [Gammaproteobacteria bacterium]
MQVLRRLIIGLIAFLALLVASLWATSMALEPDAAGEARAPDPAAYREAVVQVYGADVWGFRGNFAIHTWVATKARNEPAYTIYQVIGWRLRRGRPVVSVSEGNPAKPWYGSPAVLLHEVRGVEATALVGEIRDAVAAYPYAREYKMWPGPNSNSFVAWIGLQVPGLQLDLPAKAIGQSWMKSVYADVVPQAAN